MFLPSHVLMQARLNVRLNRWLVFQASPVTTKTAPAERLAKQQASEEEVKKREGLER